MKITHMLAAGGLLAAAALLPTAGADAQRHGYDGYHHGWHGDRRWHDHRDWHHGGWRHRRCGWYWRHHHRVRRCW